MKRVFSNSLLIFVIIFSLIIGISNHNGKKVYISDNNYLTPVIEGDNYFNIDNFMVDIEKEIIYNIPIGTRYSELLDMVSTNGEKTIYHADNSSLLEDDILSSNDILKIEFDEDNSYEYRLSILGDVLGEGEITNEGIIAVASYIINHSGLDDVSLLAADYNLDGVIKMNDVMRMINGAAIVIDHGEVEHNYEVLNGNTHTNYAETLNNALSLANTGYMIKLLSDVVETEEVTVGKNNITFDLNAKTLDMGNNSLVINGSDFVITNNTTGNGIIEGTPSNLIVNYGGLYISGNSGKTVTIQSKSDSYLARALFNSVEGVAEVSDDVTIKHTVAASSTEDKRYVVTSNGLLTVSGATIINEVDENNTTGRAININSETGRIIINSGTIQSYYHVLCNVAGTGTPAIQIDGGMITSTNGAALYNNATGLVKVNNGTLNGTVGVLNYKNGSAVVTGGVITGSDSGVYNYSTGEATITGGTIIGAGTAALLNKTNQTGTITVGDKTNSVSTSSPILISSSTSSSYATIFNQNGTFNYYDGILYHKVSEDNYMNVASTITDMPEGYHIKTVTDDTYGYKTYLDDSVAISGEIVTLDDEALNESLPTSVSCNLHMGEDSCEITFPTPVLKSGYNLVGFSKNPDATESNLTAGSKVNISDGEKYYLITSKTITITFDKNTRFDEN